MKCLQIPYFKELAKSLRHTNSFFFQKSKPLEPTISNSASISTIKNCFHNSKLPVNASTFVKTQAPFTSYIPRASNLLLKQSCSNCNAIFQSYVQVCNFSLSQTQSDSSKKAKNSEVNKSNPSGSPKKLRVLKKKKVSTDSEGEDSNRNGSRLQSHNTESGTAGSSVGRSESASAPLMGHDFLTFDPGLALPHQPPIKPAKPDYQVAAYATADEYDLEELLKGFQKLGLYERSSHHNAKANAVLGLRDQFVEEDSALNATVQQVRGFISSPASNYDELDCIPDLTEVLHMIGQYKISSEPREIFFFRDGSLVFWNVDELERSNILTYVKQFCIGDVVGPETMEEQSESLPYSYAENKTRLSGGRILLSESSPSYLERYAFSNALAHSVKLGVWETELDSYIDSIKPVAEELRRRGTIILPKKEVFLRLGQLYELRHSLTLSSDLLDTPDYYWDREHLELLYRRTSTYLSISRRTEIMSDKLNNCMQLLELLKNHHGEEQSHRLERIIIYLIIIEVVFESLHFII